MVKFIGLNINEFSFINIMERFLKILQQKVLKFNKIEKIATNNINALTGQLFKFSTFPY